MAPARRADASGCTGVTPIAAAALCMLPRAPSAAVDACLMRRRDPSDNVVTAPLDGAGGVSASDSPALSAWPQLAGGDLLLGVCGRGTNCGGRGLTVGSVWLRFSGFGRGRPAGGDDMIRGARVWAPAGASFEETLETVRLQQRRIIRVSKRNESCSA